MGIDVGSANGRAEQLRNIAQQLREVKKGINTYRLILNNNWQGTEVNYYMTTLSGITARLEAAAAELESIGSAVSSTAHEIWEEEEAERRRREEEERRRREEEAAATAAAAAAEAAGNSWGRRR